MYKREIELKKITEKRIIKLGEQRKNAIMFAIEYLTETSQQNVCDFLNSGKLDINKHGKQSI